jgi:hypothetical protein
MDEYVRPKKRGEKILDTHLAVHDQFQLLHLVRQAAGSVIPYSCILSLQPHLNHILV